MRQQNLVDIITASLVLLFVYTASSKLLDIEEFRRQMYNQPLPRFATGVLAWIVPLGEKCVSLLLLVKRTRAYGLMSAAILMFGFTIYVIVIMSSVFSYVPCSCAGIFNSMSWTAHLITNIVFTAGAFFAWRIQRQLSQ